MTTYTSLTDTTLSQDKPFTQSIARAMRDNPKALAEGDVTAPEVIGNSPMYRADASNTSALTFLSLPDSYDLLDFDFVHIYPTTYTSTLLMEVSTDNGATWLNTGYQLLDDSGSTSSSSWALTGTSNTFNNTPTVHSINGRLRAMNFSSSTVYKQIDGQFFWMSSAPNIVRKRFVGQLDSTTKFNAVRFRFNTGNIANGYIIMRRVRPS
ncbi:hypothetical protein [Rhizobium leguminosarum]|uniref:hypothetical protein n=1 Tax=Rhizobium leguminosarum TaxID=384 RepID=UPI001C988FDE|nr:hypothetical protein [Rhizobium leguminosarum]MBY5698393.1 hypothetical protein [Rhizobium leguminosarum]